MLQELNKFYSPFSRFAGVLLRHFGPFVLHVCYVHVHGYLYKYKLLCVKKFAIFKNLQKSIWNVTFK